MVKTEQIVFRKIPVSKTAMLGLYIGGWTGIVFGLLFGLLMMLVNVVFAIVIIIFAPILLAILGVLFGALTAFGLNVGLSTANGYPLDVEAEAGKVTIRKVNPLKGAIANALHWLVLSLPFAVILGIVSLLGDVTTGLLFLFGVPIGALIIGFIFGAIANLSLNIGLSIANGFPIIVESSPSMVNLKSIDFVKMALLESVQYLIFGIIASALLVVVYLIVESAMPAMTNLASGDIFLSGMMTLKTMIAVLIIALPILAAAFGAIHGALVGLGINLGLANDFPIAVTFEQSKFTISDINTMKSVRLFLIYGLFSGITMAVIQHISTLLKSAGVGLFYIVLSIVISAIDGAVMGFAISKAIQAVKGYEMEGENLHRLFAVNLAKERAEKAPKKRV